MIKIIKNNKIFKGILLVLFPFIIGFFIDKLVMLSFKTDNQIYSTIGGILLSIWIYGGAIIFWFYVGWTFGKFKVSVIKKFTLGNILWALSLGLYTWQFKLLDDASRNMTMAGLSQHYPLGFIGIATRMIGLFTNSFHGLTIIFIAYFIMLIVFSIGFFTAIKFKGGPIYEKK